MSPSAEIGRGIATALVLLGTGAVGGPCHDPTDELRLVGRVERTAVELVAPVSEVIVGIGAERGQPVEPGQVLVRLDDTLASAEVARAEAALASARTSDRVAEHELARLRRLHRDRVASEQALERAQLERDEARARLREARARLAATRKRRADLALASPVPGRLDQLPYERGERVPAGAVVAVVLADEEPWVRVWIPQSWVARVTPGQSARVDVDGLAGTLRGRVLDVSREPAFTPHYALTERDREHLVYETRVRIEDAPRALRPGVPADVWIRGPEPAAPLADRRAPAPGPGP